MASIFVSYAREDRERVASLARALEDHGWSVWWDRNIPPGKTFDEVIEEALEAAHAVIAVWTQEGVQSRWVRTEAAEGAARGVLVPVLMEDVRIPLAFRRIQAADLRDWEPGSTHQGFDELVAALEALLDEPPRGPRVPTASTRPAPEHVPPSEPPEQPEPAPVREPTEVRDPIDKVLVRARALAATCDWTGVIEVLEGHEEQHPGATTTRAEAGRLLEEAHRRRGAAELYDEAEVLYTDGRWSEALERLERVAELDPDHRLGADLRDRAAQHVEEQHREELAVDLEAAREARRAGEWGDAKARLDRLHAAAPDDPDVMAELERANAGVAASRRYDELRDLLAQERWDDVLTGMRALAADCVDFGDPDDLAGRAEAGRRATTAPPPPPERGAGPPPPGHRRRPTAAVAVILLVVVAGVVAWLVLRDGGGDAEPGPDAPTEPAANDEEAGAGGEEGGGGEEAAEPATLGPGQRLRVEDRLEIADGRYWLEMTAPEGLRAFRSGDPEPWFVAPLSRTPTAEAVTLMQENDGNLVMYAFDPAPGEIMEAETVIWNTGTSVPGSSLVLAEEDGTGVLDIRARDGTVIRRLGSSPPG